MLALLLVLQNFDAKLRQGSSAPILKDARFGFWF
jgi:hypothetical protein